MATYRLNHQKLKFLGVILLFLPLIVSVLAEIDEDFDSVEYIPEESRETDNETEYEDADDSETTSSFSQDFLKESDSGTAPVEKPSSFYSFSVHDIHGDLVSLGEYRGKVVLVVNVASECGFTDGHYKALIRMKNVLSHTNKFEILAFPCNQFGAQEPGTNAEIEEWVQENYHPNFPLFAKVNVLDDNVPEAWQYLIEESGSEPTWNFWKYLVDETGHVTNAWGPGNPVEDIFHDVKEAVDMIGYLKETQIPRHGGEL